MRIPRRIAFPFGHVVQIREVSVKEMRDLEEAADDEDWPTEGLWIVEEETVYVLKKLPPRRKRYTVLHELGHALLDIADRALVDGSAKP